MKIKDIAKITAGIYTKPSLEGEVYFLQARDYDNYFSLRADLRPTLLYDKKVAKHILAEGDVLVTARGEDFYAIPFRCEVMPAVASSTFLIIRNLKINIILPEFVAWFINHPKNQHYLKFLAKGSSIPAINKQILGEMEITIPSIAQQKRIIGLTALVQQEKRLQTQINNLKETILNQQLLNLSVQDKKRKR